MLNDNIINTIKNNIKECMKIYYHLNSTLGPYGRDKLILDSNNNYLTTNDGATILKYLNIQDPVARLLIGIAKSQDETVGDGTTSVVLLTCLLLQNSLKYILLSIHPLVFIRGFQISLDFCLKVIDEIKISPINNMNEKELFENKEYLDHLSSIASTSISSKILARYSSHFSKLGVEAISLLRFNPTQDLIRVIGITGNSMLESKLIDGILLEISNDQLNYYKKDQQQQQQQFESFTNQFQLVLDKPKVIIGKLKLSDLNTTIQSLNISANTLLLEELESREIKSKFELIFKLGVNIIISDSLLPQSVEQLFRENCILYFYIQDSRELEILSYCLNSNLIYDISQIDESCCTTLSNPIQIQSIGDKSFIQISGISISTNSNGATVVLRSPTDSMLQECIRSFKDMLNILSFSVRNPYLIGAGGSGYIELAKRLRLKSTQAIKDEKLLIAINCFADSLEMIPAILIENAGYESIELVGKLKAKHNETDENKWMGIDLNSGEIIDMYKSNIREPSSLLSNILTLSSRAAQMILRINNNIFIEAKSQYQINNNQNQINNSKV